MLGAVRYEAGKPYQKSTLVPLNERPYAYAEASAYTMSTTATTPTSITINARIAKPVDQVWKHWTEPEHIVNWNAASDDWHCPKAENDLRVGGRFTSRMEARDGSIGFDFGGTYTAVVPHERIAYTMEEGRRGEVHFGRDGSATNATVTFDAETENPIEMQRGGWQAILDRFKAYSEKQG